jgi:hypothetical protein
MPDEELRHLRRARCLLRGETVGRDTRASSPVV